MSNQGGFLNPQGALQAAEITTTRQKIRPPDTSPAHPMSEGLVARFSPRLPGPATHMLRDQSFVSHKQGVFFNPQSALHSAEISMFPGKIHM